MTAILLRCRLLAVAALFSLCLQPVAAQDPEGVQGSALVADRGAAARAEGLGRALATALQRLTPEPERVADLDLSPLLADELVLRRFSYEQVSRPTASGIPSIRLMLNAWFDDTALRGYLVRAGLPVWRGGSVRPVLLVAHDDASGGRRLLDPTRDPLAAELLGQLSARGVLAGAPLGDLGDQHLLDAVGGDGLDEALVAARQRYPDGPLVLAWVREDPQGAAVDWHVAGAGGVERFGSSGPSASLALADGSGRLVAVLAADHAVSAAGALAAVREVERGAGEYRVWLEGMERAGAWAAASDLLASQPMVAAVVPEVASAERARVLLTLTAPLGDLLALLAADGRLRPVEGPVPDADLRLRWQD